ncbi:MAG TPA: hypothetical protein VF234_10645, partial [Limnochordia bacterium]
VGRAKVAGVVFAWVANALFTLGVIATAAAGHAAWRTALRAFRPSQSSPTDAYTWGLAVMRLIVGIALVLAAIGVRTLRDRGYPPDWDP